MRPDAPLPRTYEEIFKRALDRRGRPCKTLRLPSDATARILRGIDILNGAIERGKGRA